MKNILLAFISITFVLACANKQTSTDQNSGTSDTTATAQVVGNDADQHGCKGSAGYTWSQLKNECIRTFETGVRLDPTAKIKDKTTSAFVVTIADDKKVEIFMPSESGSFLLNKLQQENSGIWVGDSYILILRNDVYTLTDTQNNPLYEGKIAPKQ